MKVFNSFSVIYPLDPWQSGFHLLSLSMIFWANLMVLQMGSQPIWYLHCFWISLAWHTHPLLRDYLFCNRNPELRLTHVPASYPHIKGMIIYCMYSIIYLHHQILAFLRQGLCLPHLFLLLRWPSVSTISRHLFHVVCWSTLLITFCICVSTSGNVILQELTPQGPYTTVLSYSAL